MPGPSTILVVDDEVKNVKLLEALLTPRGYRVLRAFEGHEALKMVQRERPDLVLLDVMMPVLDGFEVCRRLKADPSTRFIPVVIMTALGQVEDRVKGIEAGADDFLTKPVHREELMARIGTSLRMKHDVETVQNTRSQLAKFVPQTVRRLIEENPLLPNFEKTPKDVSVLFVDITAYSRLNEILPQDQVNFLVESALSGYLDCIHTNGGDISDSAGDGLMAIFTDDDPNRHAGNAVKAALEIMESTARLNHEPPTILPTDLTLQPIDVHIGIDSGVASVGATKLDGASAVRWVYAASGPVTIVATRIMALAGPGTILVGEETARRIEGMFKVNEYGKHTLKNVTQPVMIYQIVRP